MRNIKSLSYTENQKKLLLLIYNDNGITRSELASKSGFSTLTTAKFVSEFIADGIVIETGALESTGGRRPSVLSINPDYAYILSVDVGAYSTKIGVIKLNGEILSQEVIIIDKFVMPSKVLSIKELKNKLHGLLNQYGKEKFLGLGIGISGLVDYNNKKVIYCPNIDGWNGIDVVEAFENDLDIPVFVDTSARCMALAEQKFGVGKNIQNQIFVSIGYSVGAGIILDSVLFRGASGASGELGHVQVLNSDVLCSCGNYGCLESYVTLPMIMETIKSSLKNFNGFSPIKGMVDDIDKIDLNIVLKGLEMGDKIIDEVMTDTGRMLGIAITYMANILNPELIILGGGVIEKFPIIAEEAERTIKKRSLVTIYQNLAIKKSTLKFNSPIIGSALQIANKFFSF